MTEEHGVWSKANEEGLCLFIPLDASFSIGDTKNVSESEIAVDCTLNNVIAVVKDATELPDIALSFNHNASGGDFNISESNIVVELWVPHVIQEDSGIGNEIFQDKVHQHLICVSSNGTKSHLVENSASCIIITDHEYTLWLGGQ